MAYIKSERKLFLSIPIIKPKLPKKSLDQKLLMEEFSILDISVDEHK